ncbi:MAG: hypothetical protein U0746_10715 [Gemmataceae bacterium]
MTTNDRNFEDKLVTALTKSLSTYAIRRLLPADAPGLVECVRAIYGTSYVHPELYDAEQIVRLNDAGELVSFVALDGDGRVVGHYALVRPRPGGLAETGEAMVLPEHRHHELMDRMREVLEAEAARLGVAGLFGHLVTNHVFSQRVVERFGETPCAALFGWSPRTFHNMAEPLAQRLTTLLYFKYLCRPASVPAYLPAYHRPICERVYGLLSVGVEPQAGTAANCMGELVADFREDLERGGIRVTRVGADTPTAIVAARDQLRGQGAEAVFLELPLAQAGTPDVCRAAEEAGFWFAGIAPGFATDGDALLLQWLDVTIDIHALQIDHPIGRELAEYAERERERVQSGAAAD